MPWQQISLGLGRAWRPSAGKLEGWKPFLACNVLSNHSLSCYPGLSKVDIAGKIVTRSALVTNEKILTLAIKELGSRVAVQVVYLHLLSFYEYVNVPIDSALHACLDHMNGLIASLSSLYWLNLGAVVHSQAWYLRRCMTIYNDICRRHHLPREPAIRRVMANTGIDMTLYGPASEEILNDEEEEAEAEAIGEEGQEAEEEEEDEGAEDACFPAARVTYALAYSCVYG